MSKFQVPFQPIPIVTAPALWASMAEQRVVQVEMAMWTEMAAQLIVFYGEVPIEFTEAMEAILTRYYAATYGVPAQPAIDVTPEPPKEAA